MFEEKVKVKEIELQETDETNLEVDSREEVMRIEKSNL